MTSRAALVHPPRLAVWLVHLFAAGVEAESLTETCSRNSPTWPRDRDFTSPEDGFGGRLETRLHIFSQRLPGRSLADRCHRDRRGLLLNRVVSRLPEPAIFAVLTDIGFSTVISARMYFLRATELRSDTCSPRCSWDVPWHGPPRIERWSLPSRWFLSFAR